jgi:hypothetical protein
MKASNLIGSLALIAATSFATQASAAIFAPSVTNLGNLNTVPFVEADLIQFNSFFSPDYYTFSLSTSSNVNVDFSYLASVNLGAKFSLYDSTGSTLLKSFNFPTVLVAGGPELTFANVAAGSYQFKFTSFVSAGIGSNVTFTATPVPEPETNALMLVGLGIIGFIARRKYA